MKAGGEEEGEAAPAAERSLPEMLKRRLSSTDDNKNVKEEEVEDIDPKGGGGVTEEDKLSALLKELYKRMVRDLILFFCSLYMEIRLLLSSSQCSALPPYSRPVFVRLAERVEVTGTFKVVRRRMQEEGFDPKTGKDPVYGAACLFP